MSSLEFCPPSCPICFRCRDRCSSSIVSNSSRGCVIYYIIVCYAVGVRIVMADRIFEEDGIPTFATLGSNPGLSPSSRLKMGHLPFDSGVKTNSPFP